MAHNSVAFNTERCNVNGLDRKYIAQIIKLIIDYKKPEKIVIFGSRATNNFKAASDIDIAILGKDWIDKDINIVKHILDEKVKIPLKFDVLNFYTVTKEKLKQHILKEGKVIYESRKS